MPTRNNSNSPSDPPFETLGDLVGEFEEYATTPPNTLIITSIDKLDDIIKEKAPEEGASSKSVGS
jgi:hypothetical protein